MKEKIDCLDDLLIEFDEMGFVPTNHPHDHNSEYYAKDWKNRLINALEGYRKQSYGCDYCKQGDEKCGTCVEFFKGMDGCAAECDNEKCITYKPVHYCHNCGAKMKGVSDERAD